MKVWPRPRKPRPPVRGMGDVVAAVAQPVAAAIDAVAGTSIKTCSACQKRRDALNKILPFGNAKD